MSADNDNINPVIPNESDNEKLPDSIDPKARPEEGAVREELFKQNILMDVDERPEGMEAYEYIDVERQVESADEAIKNVESVENTANVQTEERADSVQSEIDDSARIASEPVAGLVGPTEVPTAQTVDQSAAPRQQEEFEPRVVDPSAFYQSSVDQEIEEALAQQPSNPADSVPNQNPEATDSSASTTEDNLFLGQLVASDPDAGDTLTYSLTNAPTEGDVIIEADGSFQFNPGGDFNDLAVGEFREVTFDYQVQDNSGAFDTAEMTIRVMGTNDGPSAIADFASTNEGLSTSINVLANDFDPDASDSLSVVNASITSGNGSLGVVGDSLLYVPHASYNALADGEQVDVEIEYTIQDPHGALSTATATVTVTGVNDGIELTVDSDSNANSVSETASIGDSVGITALAIDPDTSDSVTYSLTNNPNNAFAIDPNTGEVTVADPNGLDFEVAPTMQIEVTSTSSDGSSSSAAFDITIADDNSEFNVSPVIDADTTTNEINEVASIGDSVGVTAFAQDQDASDSVTYTLTSNQNSAFAIDPNTGEVTVADPNGLDFESAQTMQIEVTATSDRWFDFIGDLRYCDHRRQFGIQYQPSNRYR